MTCVITMSNIGMQNVNQQKERYYIQIQNI